MCIRPVFPEKQNIVIAEDSYLKPRQLKYECTVKTLYNITRYNRIFNIRHKVAGNGSVSIKIPSLQQNIHLTTPTVTSRNRYTFSIENKFIITELLPCVRHFCDQNKVI